ncbi:MULTISPECIES: hypothetical protein [unclassified Streptomyces]|uniref:hypothetical protein n=1 Tax=unclassified Streptomyces TaxID=2593676 RepID=UPI00278C5E03|nr:MULTISPECIES: hypothetical protein [unclassified Streptomyces]
MSLPTSLRRLLSVPALLGALFTGGAFGLALFGAFGGPLWLFLLGLTLSALALVLLGRLVEEDADGARAAPLRPGGPRAHAPALVRGVRAVHKGSDRPALDPRAPHSEFLFDLVVVPEDAPAFHVQVRHPLDLQSLSGRGRDRAVVEYDPEQPWRAVLPNNPPTLWWARAERLDPDALGAVGPPSRGVPVGVLVLALGLVIAVAVAGPTAFTAT